MKKIVIIGGGVIGGGWVARFLLNGYNVTVYDPDPTTKSKISKMLGRARHALPALYDYALPTEGKLCFADNLQLALADAFWVQENVPERLEIKHKIHEEIAQYAPASTIIASSTSGFKPSQLNQKGRNIIVAHPFHPVYLLPLVELVGDKAQRNRAAKILHNIGMLPLQIEKEIEAHIADRLLEAMWRESLWLVKDGIATTETIDDAIRMGFGLRYAQMGMFETYRIAGGEAGMKHFLAQFGPALKWPWTKLMDVPIFDDALVDLIATQSDTQSGDYSISELETIRDNNLVAIMRTLKERNWGVGKIIKTHEQQIEKTPKITFPMQNGSQSLFCTLSGNILPAWLDYNGHMTEFRYGQIISDASDQLLFSIGVNLENAALSGSYFTVESRISYQQEMKLGEKFSVYSRVLNQHPKKLHLYHELMNEHQKICAYSEQLMLYVDHKTRKSADAPEAIQQKITDYRLDLPIPNNIIF